MKKRTAYHPLRQLQIAGNPNRTTTEGDVTPPLDRYLREHGVDPAEFRRFRQQLGGCCVTPFSSDYAQARREADNAYDKYPLMVVYCSNTADVVSAIQFCKSQGVKVCSRAGGHSTAGYSVLNDRVVVDVSRIKGIAIDGSRTRAEVGAGVTWGEFNAELNAFGRHTPGGSCSGVGVTGFTMGGGYGYTAMRFGMACDNLVAVRLVTAEGQIVDATEAEHPELLWAHRGGTGGNFGIVTQLTYRLHELQKVWPLAVNWPIEDAANALHTWQERMTKTLADRHLGLLGFLATSQVQDRGADGEIITRNVPYFCVRGMYSGEDAQAGARALAPLLEVGCPSYPSGPLWQERIDYSDANAHLLDNVEGVIPDTIKETKRCAYVRRALTLEDYQQLVDYYKTSPNLYNIVSMEPYGGAINEVAADATAFCHRDAHFDIFVDSFWQEDGERDEAFAWLAQYFEGDQTRHLWSERYYQNYPNSAYHNWQSGYFGDNYTRLQQVKKQWDPTNFFTFEQGIELPTADS